MSGGLLAAAEVAEILGIRHDTLNHRIARGRFPRPTRRAVNRGGRNLWSLEAVACYVANVGPGRLERDVDLAAWRLAEAARRKGPCNYLGEFCDPDPCTACSQGFEEGA